MEIKQVKVEVLLPEETIIPLRDALHSEGFLKVGDYDFVVSFSHVHGYYRPLETSNPFKGKKGVIQTGTECKLTFRCMFEEARAVRSIIERVHPYEEPVMYVMPLLDV